MMTMKIIPASCISYCIDWHRFTAFLAVDGEIPTGAALTTAAIDTQIPCVCHMQCSSSTSLLELALLIAIKHKDNQVIKF
jgi:hypothetical protein